MRTSHDGISVPRSRSRLSYPAAACRAPSLRNVSPPSRNFAIQRQCRPSDNSLLIRSSSTTSASVSTLVDRSLQVPPVPVLPNPAAPSPTPTAGHPTRAPPAAGRRWSSLRPRRRHRRPARLRHGGAQRSDQGRQTRLQQCSAITHSSYLRSA